ncbi:MAG: hypothetical protein V1835_02145 [Candidatus Micrarchaeota archaeon]
MAVLDSSALISLSESCVVSVLRHLKEKSKARFAAPESVFVESVERPAKTRQHGFSAVRIKKLFSEGIVEKITASQEKTRDILNTANNLFFVGNVALELIQVGEAECAAVIGDNPDMCMIIDEKTLRLLIESPNKLRAVLEGEYGEKIKIDGKMLEKWQHMTRGIKVLRSVEVLGVAVEKGYFRSFGEDENLAYHSAVFALRGFGCSLTNSELNEFEQLFARGR